MDKYTIYCTKEQTGKALELGAPIDHSSDKFDSDCMDNIEKLPNGLYAIIPTAEQMISWLRREKGIFVSTEPYKYLYQGTYRIRKDSGVWGYMQFVYGYFETPEEATINAIDAALDYLIENKK